MRFDISLNKNIIKLYPMFIHIDAWYMKYKNRRCKESSEYGLYCYVNSRRINRLVAGMIMGKDIPGGIIGNIIAGLIGSAVGSVRYLGTVWGGVPIIPALIGAIIVIFVVSLILKALRK